MFLQRYIISYIVRNGLTQYIVINITSIQPSKHLATRKAPTILYITRRSQLVNCQGH